MPVAKGPSAAKAFAVPAVSLYKRGVPVKGKRALLAQQGKRTLSQETIPNAKHKIFYVVPGTYLS